MQPLERIISELKEMHPEMVRLAGAIEHRGAVGYFRPIQPEESMADVMAEADAHGSVVAMKGEVVYIMPKMVEGWMQIFGRRRTDEFATVSAIRESMEEVDEH